MLWSWFVGPVGPLAVLAGVVGDGPVDEIGDLARALESMRLSLKENFGVLTADRDKLTAIFDGLTDAVMVVDDDGPVRFHNSAANALLDQMWRQVRGERGRERGREAWNGFLCRIRSWFRFAKVVHGAENDL